MDTTALKRRAIISLLWKLFERGGRALVELIVQIVMSRLLVPEQFGALSIMLVFVNVGNVIVQSGMNTALIQAQTIGSIDCSTVFWMSFVISVLLYGTIFTAAPTIAAFYSSPALMWPLRIISTILIINSYNSIQIALITRSLDMEKVFRATVASSLISAVFGIAFALAGCGVWALVVQQLSYQIVNCVSHALQLDWRPRFEFSIKSAYKHFGFGSRLLASGILNQLYQSLSDLIIGRVFSASQLGLVSQGKRYPQAIGNVLDGAIQPVMLSSVSQVQDNAARAKSLVRRALKTSTFLVVPAMSLLVVIAPTFIPLLFGPQWTGSVWFMQAYCLVYAMLPIHTTNLQALNGMGRSDLYLKLEVIKKIVGAIAIVVTAFVFRDVQYMVGSYVLTGVLSTFINAWPNRRVIGYSYGEQVRDIAPAVLLTVVSAAAGWTVSLLPVPSLLLVLLQVAVFVAVYFGLAAILRVEEFSYLYSTLRDLLSR